MGAGYCQWVVLLTEIYVIYMETHTLHVDWSIGHGRRVCDGHPES